MREILFLKLFLNFEKVFASREASGDVIVFLDSHCEVIFLIYKGDFNCKILSLLETQIYYQYKTSQILDKLLFKILLLKFCCFLGWGSA